MAENEEELKNLLMRMKEESEKAGLKLIIKKIYFCYTDYTKAFDCMDHNKLWKILKEVGIPECLAYLLRNLYVGQKQ